MIDEGLIIMAVGMLVVFAFLTVMVVIMRLMSGFIIKRFPESEESVRPRPPVRVQPEAAGLSGAAAAAEAGGPEIAAAVAAASAAAQAVEAEIAAAVAAAGIYY